MKKFIDYVKLQEISAMNMGKEMLGGSSSIGLDARTQAALSAAIEAFELILGERPGAAMSWLKAQSNSIPEVRDTVEAILKQHDFESLSDLRTGVSRAGSRISGMITKGLGDVSKDPNADPAVNNY